ncbi:N-acetylmuramate alpha-1-phosphate uridylyltransferase [uncultured Gammaproteobacteria bacterium]
MAQGIKLRRAMVLAAGLGLRMRPLTLERPKPLLSVAGTTMLDHALDRLAKAGVERALVNAHYKAEMVVEAVRGRLRPTVEVSVEPALLETGGGVRRSLPWLGPEPFAVANADILWFDGAESALAGMARQWDGERMDALLLMMPVERAFGYDGDGDFTLADGGPGGGLDGEGKGCGRLARRRPDTTAPYVFAGVQITCPEAFHDTPEGPFSNNLVWNRAEAAGRLWGMVHDGAWYHIGTPQALTEARRRLGE